MSDAARPNWASQRAMSWVIDDAPVSTALFPVLMVIARRCDENGRGSYQSVPTIAEKTGKSPDQVRRDIRELKKLGLLVEGDATLTKHLPEWKRPMVYDLPLHVSGPKPVRESKNKTGVTGQGECMDAPPGMDATPWHGARQGGCMDAESPPGMDAPQTKPLKNKKNNPSLSRSDDDVTPATIPAQRTERENEEASQKPKSKKPADRTSLLLGAGLTPDETKAFTDWCDQLPSGPKGDGWYIHLHGNGTLQERIDEWRTSPAVVSRCDECDDTGETGDWLNRRPCGCLWWKDPATARKHFVAELKNFPHCDHGVAGGDLKAPDGWQYCSMCRGPGWVDRDVQPRTGKRSTGALRAEQGLRVADELDRQFGHGRWATGGLDEYGNGVRPGGGYHHLRDSRAPNRDYHEKL